VSQVQHPIAFVQQMQLLLSTEGEEEIRGRAVCTYNLGRLLLLETRDVAKTSRDLLFANSSPG